MVCFVHEAFFLLEIRCRSVIFFISTPTNLKVFGMASEIDRGKDALSELEEDHPKALIGFSVA
jgi:hypothetical protein